MGILEDGGKWCFHEKHLEGIESTLIGCFLVRWDPSALLEELTNRRPDVNWQDDALREKGRRV